MKALLITTMIMAGSLAATTGYSQVYVNARVGFRIPAPRVYCAPAPAPVVYQDEYAPAPENYNEGYAPSQVVVEDVYPPEAYYGYPAWQGHYRDRLFFDHYRPFVARDWRFRDHGRNNNFGHRGDYHNDNHRDYHRDYHNDYHNDYHRR